MTVVSTQEFNTHQEKYFDMAVDGDVCIQNDKYMFHLICNPAFMIDKQDTLQSDNDCRKSKKEISDFQKFILAGPIMSDEQYSNFNQQRLHLNQWRIQ